MVKFLLLTLFCLFSLTAEAGRPEIPLARGFMETLRDCRQGDADACALHEKIKAYNEAAALCNDRGFFGGQSEESEKACDRAQKILDEAGGDIQLDQ